MALQKHRQLDILVTYQSNRKVVSSDRFIGPLLGLANRGHRVRIISEGVIDPTGFLKCYKIRKIPFPFFPSLPFLIQSLLIAFSITKKHCIDLFLVYREEDLLVGWFINKLNNCRLIYYAHGDSITVQQFVSDSMINKLKVSVLIMFERIFLPKADLILAVSRDTKLRLLSRLNLDSNKIRVVHNNVLSPLLYSRPLFKKNRQIIGYVGHFSRLKGIETLLSAFFLTSKSIDDVILVLVGDGPLKKHLEDLTNRMGLQEKVFFTGWVKNPLDFMRDFDILVVPSLYEGCPSVILEAFSLDIPVLGSKAGGIPELLGHSELMFPVMSEADLSSRLRVFLESEENRAYLRKLTIKRKKEFTFNHIYRLEQLFLQSL